MISDDARRARRAPAEDSVGGRRGVSAAVGVADSAGARVGQRDGGDRARHEGGSGARRCRAWMDGASMSSRAARYILLNKPRGYVTTRSDPQGRRTVMDLLTGVREYVYPVGRLDYDSEGLLLLTNDGELAAQAHAPEPRCGARVRSARSWRSGRPRGRPARARHHARWTSNGAGACRKARSRGRPRRAYHRR